MQSPLSGLVRMIAQKNHPDNGHSVWDRGNQADPKISFQTKGFHNRRQPEGNAVQADHQCEIDRAQHPDFPAGEGIYQFMLGFMLVFSFEVLRKQCFFLTRKPFRFSNAALQIKDHHQANEN